ncbi:hypothetical protein [Xanthobacter pseudotagetidis]|uniref:hypothetical protein n=1 Tax=Xanthobacter pseudotagetidis TaxID=3119911 RepID=UPI003726BCFA
MSDDLALNRNIQRSETLASSPYPDREAHALAFGRWDEIVDHWSKLRYWKAAEAAALIMGYSPAELPEEVSSSRRFTDLVTLISRASSKSKPSPAFLLARLQRLDIALPEGLLDACEKHRKAYRSDHMTKTDLEQELEALRDALRTLGDANGGKEKKSIFMIAAAALRLKYGDMRLSSPKIASEVESWLTSANVVLQSRTVDKWLMAIEKAESLYRG